MNSRKLADWSEIVSSVVVVLTLVFLIVEIRTQTKAIERQAAQMRAENFAAPFLDSDLLISASRKVRMRDGAARPHEAFADRYGMSFEEAEVWNRHHLKTWFHLQSDFRYGDRALTLAVVEGLLRFPDQRVWIEINLGTTLFDAEFEGEIAKILERLPPPPSADDNAGASEESG